MESYLKYTFSRDILIFAMAWMGTRDIYIALLITIVFSICMNYLFNEESAFCCLPKSFTEYHTTISENFEPSPDEIEKAKKVLEQAHIEVVDKRADTKNTLGKSSGDNSVVPYSS